MANTDTAVKDLSQVVLRKPQIQDVPGIVDVINHYARAGLMLARSRHATYQNMRDFVVAVDGDKVIGNRTRVKVVKNKLAPPFREAEFDIKFGIGIDKVAEMLDAAVEDQVVEKSGAWYSYSGERLGQGKDNVVTALKADSDKFDAIKAEVAQLRGLA